MRRTRTSSPEIELDLGRYELRRDGRRVRLEKKPMELFILLVSRREQLVSRQEIVAKLWRSNLLVDTEPNINNIVRKIRTALGDNSARPHFLETVVGKGYRFTGPVRVIDAHYPQFDSGSGAALGAIGGMAGGGNQRSSLAILPLRRFGKAPDDDGICLRFADALVSRLGNLQGVDVLPVSAVLNVPAEATASESASRLGVRFIVHGAIQMSKGIWRLSVEMFDIQTQSACFTRKRDLELSRLPELEDQIAKKVPA